MTDLSEVQTADQENTSPPCWKDKRLNNPFYWKQVLPVKPVEQKKLKPVAQKLFSSLQQQTKLKFLLTSTEIIKKIGRRDAVISTDYKYFIHDALLIAAFAKESLLMKVIAQESFGRLKLPSAQFPWKSLLNQKFNCLKASKCFIDDYNMLCFLVFCKTSLNSNYSKHLKAWHSDQSHYVWPRFKCVFARLERFI